MGICSSKQDQSPSSLPTTPPQQSPIVDKPLNQPVNQLDPVIINNDKHEHIDNKNDDEETDGIKAGTELKQVIVQVDAAKEKDREEVKVPVNPQFKSSNAIEAPVTIDKRRVDERYEVGNELGRGCFGVVKLCREKSTGKGHL
uniref:Protein kinase domain-containing protein n=1 Tax=Spongospora subterranea TaxID=70186 RepID=A0A0H5QLM1_9EUKA|eukprot:CRZ03050.1 hypothetical protein [Spongospora subterranea]